MSKIDHPEHYNPGAFEVINIIEAYDLKFTRGNVIKYVLRAGKKGDEIEDLEKALWYLKREIENLCIKEQKEQLRRRSKHETKRADRKDR
jgi:hypothetical protein